MPSTNIITNAEWVIAQHTHAIHNKYGEQFVINTVEFLVDTYGLHILIYIHRIQVFFPTTFLCLLYSVLWRVWQWQTANVWFCGSNPSVVICEEWSSLKVYFLYSRSQGRNSARLAKPSGKYLAAIWNSDPYISDSACFCIVPGWHLRIMCAQLTYPNSRDSSGWVPIQLFVLTIQNSPEI